MQVRLNNSLVLGILLLCSISLTSNAVFAIPASVHMDSDPTCSTGIPNGNACCPAICGQCGGPNCYDRAKQFGTRCCPSGITKPGNGVPSCSESLPPCVLGSPPAKPSPSPSPKSNNQEPATSTLTGEWSLAQYRKGAPEKRHEACAVMVKGLVVLVGGRGSGKPTSIYNPKNGTWWEAPAAGRWENIHHFQCVAIGWSVWIVASWKKFFPFEEVNEHVYEFNVQQNKWYFWPPMPANRNRGGAAAVHKGDFIYVIAGNRGGHGAHATSLGWMDAFNWRKKEWSTEKFPDVPGPGRDHVGAALVRGRICIAGGRDGGSAKFFNSVNTLTYCYNFKTKKWIKRADFPNGRAGANYAQTCDGRMMIAGGEGFGKAFDDVHVFDYYKWDTAPKLADPRHGSGVAVSRCSCGHLFIPSGANRQGGAEVDTTNLYIPKGAPNQCSRY